MEKIRLSGVPETMLQTMHARAAESMKKDHVIYDPVAVGILERLDYDFSKAAADRKMSTGVIARTVLLDRMTEEFLNNNPNATVINIASGLDTRCCRFEGRYRAWYNLDLPETMEVRRRFLVENGPVFQIPASVLDEKWVREVTVPENSPVLVIIEGLTMYLDEGSVRKIFSILGKSFPDASVFVETMSPFVVSHIKEKSIEGSHAKFSWGVRNGSELSSLLGDFVNVEEHSLAEGMAAFIPIYRVIGKIGFIRNISNRIIVMRKRA